MQKKSEIVELLRDVREGVLYLQELGVGEWNISMAETGSSDKKAVTPVRAERVIPDDIPFAKEKVSGLPHKAGGSRLTRLPKIANRSDGTPGTAGQRDSGTAGQWDSGTAGQRDSGTTGQRDNETAERIETLFELAPTLNETTETIESIRAEIGDCRRCELCDLGRKQIVHSTGNFNADLMFVGEAPGADEDEQGFPFVGRAGQLLTKIIESIGLKREEVFIGNINRCRPPGNRQPLPAETSACRPFLLREVAVVRPKVIVVLGNTATQNLLDIKTPISKLRGNFQDYFGVKVMPTFHPAYLLRDPHKKRDVWEDMKKVRDYLNSLEND